MSVLSVSGLGKTYIQYRSEIQRLLSWFGVSASAVKQVEILRNVSFQLHPGESLGIIGVNGAGKSTLLKMIAGTLRPSSGSSHVNGRVAALLELGMGFSPSLTGRENARRSLGLAGFAREEIEDKLPDIEEFADIGEYFNQPARTYSSGMQARVAFAIATAWRPDLLIVDEALSVGDAFFQAKCFSRINTYVDAGTALILVTHSVDTVVRQCDRAIFLEGGGIKADGDPRTIANMYLEAITQPATSTGDNHSPGSEPQPARWASSDQKRFHERSGYLSSEHRWGNGQAEILDFCVRQQALAYPPTISSGASVTFEYSVLFHQSIDHPVPGLLIKTIDGISVYGTNSILCQPEVTQVRAEAGTLRRFAFTITLAVASGDYLVSFGMSSEDPVSKELAPLDRRYDSVLVSVIDGNFTGLADLCATLESENV